MKRFGHSGYLVARAFEPGETYVLADLGDDVIDLTVYGVIVDDRFEKMCHAAGCAWGSSYVKNDFVDLLETMFGKDTIEKYKTDYPGDWDDLFSLKFEAFSTFAFGTNYVELPFSFHSFIGERDSSFKDDIAAQGNASQFTRCSLAITYPEVKKLFEPVFYISPSTWQRLFATWI